MSGEFKLHIFENKGLVYNSSETKNNSRLSQNNFPPKHTYIDIIYTWDFDKNLFTLCQHRPWSVVLSYIL